MRIFAAFVSSLFIASLACAQMTIPPMSDPWWDTSTGIKFRCDLETTADLVYEETQLPDHPTPKVQEQQLPASEMTRKDRDAYLAKKYPDKLDLERPVGSTAEALRTRGMFIFGSLFVASVVADIEGTQHCISNHTCSEGNPLYGGTRARAYGVGIPLAAAAIWSTGWLRKNQHGSTSLLILWPATMAHITYAVKGFRE